VPTPHRQSSLDTLKKLDKLTDELETAKHASEITTKEVQHARRTTQRVKRDVRVQLLAERNGRKGRNIKGGKSEAAVELGQKGGAARAKMLTAKQRSALATKAAKVRWNSAR
jgi:ABC-type hemin transport system substrate-binding protein